MSITFPFPRPPRLGPYGWATLITIVELLAMLVVVYPALAAACAANIVLSRGVPPMYLNARVSRLENRHPLIEEDGFRPCVQCNNGEKRQIVIRFEGEESSDPLPTCPRCGRDTACVINICSAEPVGTHDPRLEPANDRPSLSAHIRERGGDDSGDARADL